MHQLRAPRQSLRPPTNRAALAPRLAPLGGGFVACGPNLGTCPNNGVCNDAQDTCNPPSIACDPKKECPAGTICGPVGGAGAEAGAGRLSNGSATAGQRGAGCAGRGGSARRRALTCPSPRPRPRPLSLTSHGPRAALASPQAPDGCGGYIQCGLCPKGQSCSLDGKECVNECVPAIICDANRVCGTQVRARSRLNRRKGRGSGMQRGARRLRDAPPGARPAQLPTTQSLPPALHLLRSAPAAAQRVRRLHRLRRLPGRPGLQRRRHGVRAAWPGLRARGLPRQQEVRRRPGRLR
jgi:hypothetical protein